MPSRICRIRKLNESSLQDIDRLLPMDLTPAPPIAVVDFRRQSMVLEWQSTGGTWRACDEPPMLVHGVALIRASQPNICLFAREDRLHLQVGGERYPLVDDSPRIGWRRGRATFGLRRSFTISSPGGTSLVHTYWNNHGDDFFVWLVTRLENPEWRKVTAQRWSEGVNPAALRGS
jgi:hypothetical protein